MRTFYRLANLDRARWYVVLLCVLCIAFNVYADEDEIVATSTLTPAPAPVLSDITRPDNGKITLNKPTNQLNNPYRLLVGLAFGNKNDAGISSYAQAFDYFCQQARDSNDANAQFAMGWLYSMGKGVEVNQGIATLF